MTPSSRIDRYEPEERLGAGGLVDTFRARIDSGQTRAVLKVLFLDRGDESITTPAAERFLRAGRRCREMSEPGIARVIDVSDDPAAAFVATELVPGVDLARLVQMAHVQGTRKAVPPNVAAMICAQVARAVDRAHSRRPPLFHLGLGPGNVLVSADGTVTVLDFGLTASLRTKGVGPVEQWHFVAPEAVEVDAWELPAGSARAADLYSLGALLYFMLTGRPPGSPETGGSLKELARRKRQPPSFPAGLPDGIVQAARMLTAADPADRPRSASAAVELLCAEPLEKAHLEQALRALGVFSPTLTEAPAAPSPPLTTTPGLTIQPRPLVAPGTSKRGDARVGRPNGPRHTRRRRIGQVLIASAAVVAALGTYLGLGSRRPHTSPRVATTELLSGPRATEISAPPAAPAGAAPPGNPEIPGPGHGYVPDPARVPTRIPGHLFIDTSPSQAAVWIDGALRGKTPVDLEVGSGVHRMVAIKPGYRMWLAVYDTSHGEFARREFQAANPPIIGDAFLDVRCPVSDRYPIILDDEETGLLCPVERLPVVSGKHSIGIFVPARRANVITSVVVLRGPRPVRVDLKD